MNSTTCRKCGLVAFATSPSCKRCGTQYAPASSNNVTQTFGEAQSAPGGARPSAVGPYYKPSGEVTVAGLAAGVVGGLVAAVALGFAYAYLISYVPIVYLNILCVIGYALVLGAVAAALVNWGKMRNPAVGMFIAMFVTLVSYYVSWAVWLSITVSNDTLSISSLTLAQNPGGLWELLQLVNQKGAWSIGRNYGSSKNSNAVSGVLLWVFWAAEALTVLIGSAATAWMGLTSDPFCESCQTWCKEEKELVSIQAAGPDELRRRFEAKDFEYLKLVGPRYEGDAEWCRLDLHRCPGCGKTNTLSVKRETLQIDRKGKRTVTSKDVFHGLLLTEVEVHQLRQVSAELNQSQSVAA